MSDDTGNEKKIYITFHSTDDAVLVARECKKNSIPGRLCPVPQYVNSGCGMSFSTNLKNKEKLLEIVEEAEVRTKNVYELDL